MNKRGFTLVELLATIVIIGLIMMIVLPSALRTSERNSETMYKEYEKMLVEYAKSEEFFSDVSGYFILEEIDGLEKMKEDCDLYSYVKAYVDDNNNVQYSAFVRCGYDMETDTYKYVTDGFNPGELLQ